MRRTPSSGEFNKLKAPFILRYPCFPDSLTRCSPAIPPCSSISSTVLCLCCFRSCTRTPRTILDKLVGFLFARHHSRFGSRAYYASRRRDVSWSILLIVFSFCGRHCRSWNRLESLTYLFYLSFPPRLARALFRFEEMKRDGTVAWIWR